MIETVGKYLKEVRENKGVTLDAIAEETKIQKRYLVDIENDDFDELPGEAYVKGFLRNYAAALKIDSEEVITLYKKMQLKSEESANIYEETPVVIEKAKVKKLNKLIIGLVIILFLFGIYLVFANKKFLERAEKETVPVNNESIETPVVEKVKAEPVERAEKEVIKEEIATSTSIASAGSVTVSKNITPAAITGQKVFELNFKGDSWVDIRENGKMTFSGMAYQGQKKIIRNDKEVYIKIGKASNAEIKLNGQLLEIKGDGRDFFRQTWK